MFSCVGVGEINGIHPRTGNHIRRPLGLRSYRMWSRSRIHPRSTCIQWSEDDMVSSAATDGNCWYRSTIILDKNGIQLITQSQIRNGFYQRKFKEVQNYHKSGTFEKNTFANAKFKRDYLKVVMGLLLKGDWAISIDLTDAYLHVPICPNHRKCLKFPLIISSGTFHSGQLWYLQIYLVLWFGIWERKEFGWRSLFFTQIFKFCATKEMWPCPHL